MPRIGVSYDGTISLGNFCENRDEVGLTFWQKRYKIKLHYQAGL